jgi:hypothetical protein
VKEEAAMFFICEHQLYEEHRSAEETPFDICLECGKFPSNEGGSCYHCFSVGNTIDECPECLGKPWSDEFLAVKAQIERDNAPPPSTIH